MHARASPTDREVQLSALPPGTRGRVLRVGHQALAPTLLERRLLELGFIAGEEVRVVAETWPGRDPFVVRIGDTTLALRRREAESVYITLTPAGRAV